ncbi:MAG: ATP-binding protein [Pirellulales bacterium]
MNDRRRLLVFSILILATVCLVAIGITAYDLYSAAFEVQRRGLAESVRREARLLVALVQSEPDSDTAWRRFVAMSYTGDGQDVTTQVLLVRRDGRQIVSFRRLPDCCHQDPRPISELSPLAEPAAKALSGASGTWAGRDDEGRRVLAAFCPVGKLGGLVTTIDMAEFRAPFVKATILAGELGVLILIGGAALLLRASNPFMRRLEENEARMRAMVDNLETKAQELARTNQDLDEFTYIASHDLKEPLRGISAYCQILLEDYGDKLDADGCRRLHALVGLCRRLGQLIEDLLTYSQIGRRQGDRVEVDLNAVVKDVLETLAPIIDHRKAEVRVVERLPVVAADPIMVGEVFRNLIANALKFNESDRPTVEIGCLAAEQPTIYVRDNGIGIPEHQHEVVFTMFRRLHSRQKYDGTGAGLTIVRKIVESQGGRIWLESEPGLGSTFHFTLLPESDRANQELAAGVADRG